MPQAQACRDRAATMEATVQSPARRGRPSRLSRERILSEALAVLTDTPINEFSLGLVAKRVGATAMSLYTYFPSRDALLLALAEDVFRRFEAPAPAAHWRDEITDWLWATVHHLDRYPVALKLSMWDGHISPGWLKTWLPIAALMRAQGLQGSALAFAMSWFTTTAMGFITAQMASPANRQRSAIAYSEDLSTGDQRLAVELWLDLGELNRDDMLAYGFNNILDGLEALVAKNATNQ